MKKTIAILFSADPFSSALSNGCFGYIHDSGAFDAAMALGNCSANGRAIKGMRDKKPSQIMRRTAMRLAVWQRENEPVPPLLSRGRGYLCNESL